ncbi:hypothetical protein M0R45_019436 [Rubus argutus]|uniref:Secreted protein n=1 Tax=Rubus argutus TaxID=59490 RepID=A0AAW1X7W2_RUBAR
MLGWSWRGWLLWTVWVVVTAEREAGPGLSFMAHGGDVHGAVMAEDAVGLVIGLGVMMNDCDELLVIN